jgi:hypothetical protein
MRHAVASPDLFPCRIPIIVRHEDHCLKNTRFLKYISTVLVLPLCDFGLKNRKAAHRSTRLPHKGTFTQTALPTGEGNPAQFHPLVDGVKNANGATLIVGGGIRCCLPNNGDNYLPCFDLCLHFHQCTSLSDSSLTATCSQQKAHRSKKVCIQHTSYRRSYEGRRYPAGPQFSTSQIRENAVAYLQFFTILTPLCQGISHGRI